MKTPNPPSGSRDQSANTGIPPVQAPDISLPKGGGALKSIDEQFRVNAANGTASLSIPVPLSPARNEMVPSLSLSYDSGSGNSEFGLGWSLSLPSISVLTSKQLPTYSQRDAYELTGAEELVPLMTKEANGDWSESMVNDGDFIITTYRPRTEGLFARIQSITHPARGKYWKVTDRNNVTTFYGFTAAARIANPEDATQVYRWLPDFSFDDKGNWIRYQYKAENSELLPNDLSNKHRLSRKASFTNTYLKAVAYGNSVPYYPDPNQPHTLQSPSDEQHFFELILDYGEHHDTIPGKEEISPWALRGDCFSSYRSGFEIRTQRCCRRMLIFHQFHEEVGFETPCLVKSLDLSHELSPDAAEVTYLKSARQSGYIRKDDGSYRTKSMPPLTMTYQALDWSHEIKQIDEDQLPGAPTGLKGRYLWTDLYGEGIAGMLSEQASGWFYHSNLGNDGDGPAFTPARKVAQHPSIHQVHQPGVLLGDLEANGGRQLIYHNGSGSGYFDLKSGTEAWQRFVPFEQYPHIDFNDPNVRLVDLTGDGKPDLLISEHEVLTWYPSAGKQGYEAHQTIQKALEESDGPRCLFSEPVQSTFLADMTGDGLADMVRIRNGAVCYWPNLGYGRFGAQVYMDQSPVFATADQYDPGYLRLADLSGTGTTDLLYFGEGELKIYLNLNGNTFTKPHAMEGQFPIHHNAQIDVVDLMGTGVPCIVWSSDLPADSDAPFRYIDLMNSQKPHLLKSYQNNMGKEAVFAYKSAVDDYLKDKKEGNDWVTKLPFPMQVLSQTTTIDHIQHAKFSVTYSYHHGYYDHAEREFRGFGRVDQLDTQYYEEWAAANGDGTLERSESAYQPPILTRTWYHTGAVPKGKSLIDEFQSECWTEAKTRKDFPVFAEELSMQGIRLVAEHDMPDPMPAPIFRQVHRACRGMALRTEVFALGSSAATDPEALSRELTPVSVVLQNCQVRMLQPGNEEAPACFTTMVDDSITYHYEQEELDPRITHQLILETDEYNQVLRSVEVVYPRKQPDNTLSAHIREEQAKTRMVYTESAYSNDVITVDVYRLRQPAETRTYELTAIGKAGNYYRHGDFNPMAGWSVISFHLSPNHVEPEKRLVEHVRNYFLDESLANSLPLYQLPAHGIPSHTSQLVYEQTSPAILFDDQVADPQALLSANGYEEDPVDGSWWMSSGTQLYYRDSEVEDVQLVRQRFYLPVATKDPLGSMNRIDYYKDYFLFPGSLTDALHNKTEVVAMDFRTLTPQLMRDLNNNLSTAVTDELGLPVASTLLGKDMDLDGVAELQLADSLEGLDIGSVAEQALIEEFFTATDSARVQAIARSLLNKATSRTIYWLDAFEQAGKPVAAATIMRETHQADLGQNEEPALQIQVAYSDGSGQAIMTKVQADPGVARELQQTGEHTYQVVETDTSVLQPPGLRWLGNGRTVFNNKGNVVKQFEPYFATSHAYESHAAMTEVGVTPIFHYDALSRQVKTDFPDGTFSETVFKPWSQKVFDQNDTVTRSNWYHNRYYQLIDGELLDADKDPASEQQAAMDTAHHDGTAAVMHLDTLGRPIAAVAHNRDKAGTNVFTETQTHLNIEGNPMAVIDARGNAVMRYQYDLIGRAVRQESMDAGVRWTFADVLGNPVKSWDSRGHVITQTYDALHRPLTSHVAGGEDLNDPLDHVFQRQVYGEDQVDDQLSNLRGQVVTTYDTAGKISIDRYDLKGNPIRQTQQFAVDYKSVVNWEVIDDDRLETETFESTMQYDALNRITEHLHPDGSISKPAYGQSGMLSNLSVIQDGQEEQFVQSLAYNARGQRETVTYGNEVRTYYHYDRDTFRLNSLKTRRSDQSVLQDLGYTYDPVGNVLKIEDRSAPTVFFGNHAVDAQSIYRYDALYQLVEAKGREHAGQANLSDHDNWNDQSFVKSYQANDAMAWRDYTQSYQYDAVGNMTQLHHQATGGTYVRDYQYDIATNRLLSTQVGQHTYSYQYHGQHGMIQSLPHLSLMSWNFRDELQAVATQVVNSGVPETTYYVYNAQGVRVRKVTEHASATATAAKKEERYYLGSVEIYRQHTGANAGLERKTLHVTDGSGRIAMIDCRNEVNDGTAARIVRYQLSNHLGSAALEIDGSPEARVISYEEYHPYGTSAYQATGDAVQVAKKRYRYTGMERDEESGMNYHNARYYLPWLGRWLKPDPIGIQAGINDYAYVNGNPVNLRDSSGYGPDNFMEAATADPSKSYLSAFWSNDRGFNKLIEKDPTRFYNHSDQGLTNSFGSRNAVSVSDTFSINFGIMHDMYTPEPMRPVQTIDGYDYYSVSGNEFNAPLYFYGGYTTTSIPNWILYGQVEAGINSGFLGEAIQNGIHDKLDVNRFPWTEFEEFYFNIVQGAIWTYSLLNLSQDSYSFNIDSLMGGDISAGTLHNQLSGAVGFRMLMDSSSGYGFQLSTMTKIEGYYSRLYRSEDDERYSFGIRPIMEAKLQIQIPELPIPVLNPDLGAHVVAMDVGIHFINIFLPDEISAGVKIDLNSSTSIGNARYEVQAKWNIFRFDEAQWMIK